MLMSLALLPPLSRFRSGLPVLPVSPRRRRRKPSRLRQARFLPMAPLPRLPRVGILRRVPTPREERATSGSLLRNPRAALLRTVPRDSSFLPPPPIRPDLPVGARLLHFPQAWSRITDDPWILSVVRHGYVIPLSQPPPLSSTPINLTSDHPFLPQAVQMLVDKGAVERVQNPHSPGFYSRLFLVPKKDGTWRPILDLSHLNTFVANDSFKMETQSSIRLAVRPDQWGVSLDLSDAYFHVPIHLGSRKLLRFCHGNSVFQFRALPFGLSPAPRIFTKIMRAVAAHLRLGGSVLLQYFDDWLLHQSIRQSLLTDLARCWRIVSDLGLMLNPLKSDLTPSQDFIFVGMNFLTDRNTVRVPPARIRDILALVSRVLGRSQLSARSLLSLLGILSAAADFVVLGRLHLRPLQFYLLALWRPHRDPLDAVLPLRALFHTALRWWLNKSRLLRGVPLELPLPSLFLISDASKEGWGAHLEPLGLMTSGVWSPQESSLHINNLELKAVHKAVSCFLSHLKGHCVLLSTDNTTVVSYIRRQGGTHSLSLFQEVRSLFLLCQAHDISLQVKYLPGRLNALADSLSRRRQILPAEWTLHQGVAEQIFSVLGRPMVDLFATRFNHRLPLYVSPVLDPAAWGVDALSLSWDSLFAYAFPPFVLLPAVLRKVRVSRCQVLLVAPLWPQRPWFSELLDLLYAPPRRLQCREDLLSQRGVLHQNPRMFSLHVWPLSGQASERKSFLLGLPLSLPRPDDLPLLRSITPSGGSLQIGVLRGRSVHSLPLSST